MLHQITVLPQKQNIEAASGENLLRVLVRAGLAVDAPCGGNRSCGKCKVRIDGEEALACRTEVHRDMTVELPGGAGLRVLTEGIETGLTVTGKDGYGLAFDIGTTTVAGYLVELSTGRELACGSMPNPQISFGADVISRIGHALHGQMEGLTGLIRQCVADLACSLCEKAGVPADRVTAMTVVGNPAMQQLFLGILPDNLAKIPFSPVLTRAEWKKAAEFLPAWGNAELLIVPDISGFVGADTLAGILATGLHEQEELTLLVDIGTNGEMVLGNRHRMVACSTAAGPALEGANIRFGMRGQPGAIDHVRLEDGEIKCSVVGGGKAVGICGSGLIDGVAAALQSGWINPRGRILNEDRCIPLTEGVWLTQEDIRQLQLAKGAIAAGIGLMADHLGVTLRDIQRVYLAGAFGTFMDPASACRIGLIPPILEEKIVAVGNAAGSGAKLLACTDGGPARELAARVEFLELASVPEFRRSFGKNMGFWDEERYWREKALGLGFTCAVPVDVSTLIPNEEIRQMCAADKCRAYGKNWTCPPHCGTVEQCAEEIRGYARGILVQTAGKTEKTIDTKAYRRTEERHLAQFHNLCNQLRKTHPAALCLGSGGCRICKTCAWPEKCRFPEKACSSMEAYGLFVTQVCRDNDLSYHHGERTVTYTACILF